MYGGIWVKDRNSAAGEALLDRIIKDYKDFLDVDIDPNYTKVNQHERTITFTNGDVWKLIPANDNARGRAFNISYVERSIDNEIFHTVIIPCTKSYPYTAFNFFGEYPQGVGIDNRMWIG